jgi:hypothetical protein
LACARRVGRRKRRPWEAERGKWTDSRVEGEGKNCVVGAEGCTGGGVESDAASVPSMDKTPDD